jgi:nitroimidazol reductase NimA-like FMN-containing flavoprotein (pyridoxamine 5'-phosphate oxidase superfamily)
MNSIIQIRDIKIIEKEMETNYIGVLSYALEGDNLNQIPVTYIYRDKNVYLLFKPDDEELGEIIFNTHVCFTIIINEIPKEVPVIPLLYKTFSITINGPVKIVDEQKIIEELQAGYKSKYNYENTAGLSKIIMIDTQEFKAYEYSGE